MSQLGHSLRKVVHAVARGAVGRLPGAVVLPLFALPIAAAPDTPGVTELPCPPGAIAIELGESIQVPGTVRHSV